MNGRGGPKRPLHVLVVDDSALVRRMLADLLSERLGMDVDTAAHPLIALRKIAERRPDVILLDLEMPCMDGLAFLRRLQPEDPIPVVVCSSHAGRGTQTALRALEEGAIEVVAKPRLGIREFLLESVVTLGDALEAAALARRPAPLSPTAPRPPQAAVESCCRGSLIAIGASTGGPQALARILSALPAASPPVLVVQHMPAPYTRAFARRLDGLSRLEVREASDGEPVVPGRVLIAPGDRHLALDGEAGDYRARLVGGPLVSRHRPSVDVLFRSFAAVAGRHGVGVLLTGMGSDGAQGLLAMRRSGGRTLVQDAASCAVFGMPREALRLGAADAGLPLDRLAEAVLEAAARAAAPQARRDETPPSRTDPPDTPAAEARSDLP